MCVLPRLSHDLQLLTRQAGLRRSLRAGASMHLSLAPLGRKLVPLRRSTFVSPEWHRMSSAMNSPTACMSPLPSDGEGRVTDFWAFPENSQELDEFFS
jgi:hypothetical protein